MSVELTAPGATAGAADPHRVAVRGGPLLPAVPAGGWPRPVEWALGTLRSALAEALPGTVLDVRPLGLPVAAGEPGPDDAAPAHGLTVRWAPGAVLVGPVRAGSAPCGTCLDRRWLALRTLEERRALEHDDAAAFVAGRDPGLTPFAVATAVAVAVAAVGRPDRADHVYEVRTTDLGVTKHRLIADSACPDCSVPLDDGPDAVVRLTPTPKPTPTTYRLREPEDIGLPVSGYVNPVCGALGPAGLRAYHCTATAPVSGYFRVRSKYDLHDMWWSGHGDSYARSELLGVLEGLERYAGQFPRARRRTELASLAQLRDRGLPALDPRLCGAYTPDFYRHHSVFYEPFTEDRVLSWVWGASVRDDRPVLVPEQLVFYLDWRAERKFVQECSNGCASGSCPEEAVLHGLLELLERDAFLLCWFGSARIPEIDLATVRDPATRFMADRVAALGYRVRLFDMRVDLPVPLVMAVAERRDGAPGTLCFSAGAGLEPEGAVHAALCEAASYVPGFAERVEAKLPELRHMVEDPDRVTELSHHALLYGLPEVAHRADFLFGGAPPRSMDELYAGWSALRGEVHDLAEDVRRLVDLVAAGPGGDVVVVDQTCPEQREVGLTTVAVVAPGLVPIDFGRRRQRVLTSDRLRAFLAGELPQVWPRGEGFGATGLNTHPHPFP